jgi:hypothetical protein
MKYPIYNMIYESPWVRGAQMVVATDSRDENKIIKMMEDSLRKDPSIPEAFRTEKDLGVRILECIDSGVKADKEGVLTASQAEVVRSVFYVPRREF